MLERDCGLLNVRSLFRNIIINTSPTMGHRDALMVRDNEFRLILHHFDGNLLIEFGSFSGGTGYASALIRAREQCLFASQHQHHVLLLDKEESI